MRVPLHSVFGIGLLLFGIWKIAMALQAWPRKRDGANDGLLKKSRVSFIVGLIVVAISILLLRAPKPMRIPPDGVFGIGSLLYGLWQIVMGFRAGPKRQDGPNHGRLSERGACFIAGLILIAISVLFLIHSGVRIW